jgi:spermidine synthase
MSLRIGVVGLGVGTLAAYAEPGDTLRFYEISALVADLADSHFSFLAQARDRGARAEVVVGDGRITLERELKRGDRGNYDLVVVDAFSSGAIPVHLLTAECAALYAEHLASGGVIALHVSNVHLDLGPVAAGIAANLGMHLRRVTTASDSDDGTFLSKWILLSDDQAILDGVAATDELSRVTRAPEPLVWTDDYSSLFSVLR